MPSADAVSKGDKFVVVNKTPKYSIIIPAKNGMPYLKYAVTSALATECKSIEVLVSLDDTGDGSTEFFSTLADNRIRLIRAPHGLTMSEHWDFAQSHATGDWQIFLGQDDMMVGGYVEKLDALTHFATERGLAVAVCRRAYITWPPIKTPNLKPLQYWRTDELKVMNSKSFMKTALLNEISYHEGPQMYTTTVVSANLIEKIRQENQGRLILGHPQDAFLAAVLLKYAPEYIWSGDPFGWVGTSSRSAGLAITHGNLGDARSELASSYSNSVSQSSSLPYKSSVDFRHGVNSRYFYDALLGVWPEITRNISKDMPLFGLRLDSNFLACFERQPGNGVTATELVTSLGGIRLKRVIGFCLRLWRLAKRSTLEVVSFVVRSRLAKKYSYVSIKQASGLDELYLAAVKIGQAKNE